MGKCHATRRMIAGTGWNGSDQRVHRNPVTLVTPIVRCPALSISRDQQPPSRTREDELEFDRTWDGMEPNDEGHPKEGEKSDGEAHDRDT
jgi:hypothetical protein